MTDDLPTPPGEESFGHRLVRVATAAIKVAVMGEEPEATGAPLGQCTHLRVTKVTPTSIALAWRAPTTRTGVTHYTIFFRLHGTPSWSVGAVTGAITAGTVTGLKSGREYDLEVFAHSL